MKHARIIHGVLALALGLTLSGGIFAQEDDEPAGNWWEMSPWTNPDRGFNWYPPDQQLKQKKKKEDQKTEQNNKNIREMTSIEDIKKEVVRLRDVAILQPTAENIHAYLDANKYIMDKSAYFADMWQRVMWQNPDVDYNARSPQATFALNEVKTQQEISTDDLMNKLAGTHGILFFYRGECPFCHMQAPILKMLRDKYHIEVLAVSVDGTSIDEFPDAKTDNGISMYVTEGAGIEVVPSLFLISRDQKEVIPLGAGAIAMDDIVNRIRVLYSTQPGERY